MEAVEEGARGGSGGRGQEGLPKAEEHGQQCAVSRVEAEQSVGGGWRGPRLERKSFPGRGEFGHFAKCIGKPLRFLKP